MEILEAKLEKCDRTPLAAVVVGLMRDRSRLLEDRSRLLENTVWNRFDEHWAKFTQEIGEIDRRVERYLAPLEADIMDMPEAPPRPPQPEPGKHL